MKNTPKNLFIDSSVFIENNYFEGYKIKQLFRYSSESRASILITDIIKREIEKNFNADISSLKEFFNKNQVWRNLQYKTFENIFDIQRDSDTRDYISNEINTLKQEGLIEIINTPNNIANKVFDLYFESKCPFDGKNKKYEFPDAFIILTIENWCKNNRKKAVFITKDKGLIGYKSSNFKIEADLNTVLHSFIDLDLKKYDRSVTLIIKDTLDINRDTIREQIKYLVESEFQLNTNSPLFTPKEVKVNNIRLLQYKIISVDKKTALVEYNVIFKYNYIATEEADFRYRTISGNDSKSMPFEIKILLNKEIKKGGYDLIQVDAQWKYKTIILNCG